MKEKQTASYKDEIICAQTPFQRLKNSFKFAYQGWLELLRTAPNIKVHLLAAISAIILGFALHISAGEWSAVIIVITLVWVCEAFNSAIEYIVDMISPEYHPVAGKIKDLAAGAVMISALGALAVGCVIFIPKIYWLLV
jgi:diacylglycerol kinase (ATP)